MRDIDIWDNTEDLYATAVQNHFIIKGTLKGILKDIMRHMDAFKCNICVK